MKELKKIAHSALKELFTQDTWSFGDWKVDNNNLVNNKVRNVYLSNKKFDIEICILSNFKISIWVRKYIVKENTFTQNYEYVSYNTNIIKQKLDILFKNKHKLVKKIKEPQEDFNFVLEYINKLYPDYKEVQIND